MKKWIAVFVVLGLLLVGSCFGISESMADEAWINRDYEDYLTEPEEYVVCEAEVVEHFSLFDSLFTGWHYFTVVEFDHDGHAQRVAMSRDIKADKIGTRLKIAVASDYDYSINNVATSYENIPQLAYSYALGIRLTPIENHTNRNMYIIIAVLDAVAAAVLAALLKKGILA